MKSLAFALHVFSSVCIVHEGTVARASESGSETLTARRQAVRRAVFTLAKVNGKDFQLCAASPSI